MRNLVNVARFFNLILGRCFYYLLSSEVPNVICMRYFGHIVEKKICLDTMYYLIILLKVGSFGSQWNRCLTATLIILAPQYYGHIFSAQQNGHT